MPGTRLVVHGLYRQAATARRLLAASQSPAPHVLRETVARENKAAVEYEDGACYVRSRCAPGRAYKLTQDASGNWVCPCSGGQRCPHIPEMKAASFNQ